MISTRIKRSGLVLALFLFAAGGAWSQWPFASASDEKPSLAPLLRNVTPAVVNISVESQAPVATNPLFEDPFFRRFFDVPEQPQAIPQQSAGSGVIIDADQGYVLTNHHVIDNATSIVVTLSDRRRFDAELVGSDEGTDIALLRIAGDDLTAVRFGDSDDLEVGDFVIAIGNPFGLGQTVTSGIVSALGRSGLNIEGYEDFIQTDAPINPGNSGGALIDLNGELIGVNTAIVGPSSGNVGIGFAVPSNMANEVIAQLLEYGEVRRGRLGIFIQDITPDLAEALDLDTDRGALVTQVEPDSPGERAGIQPGDVIIEFNGETVDGSADLRNKVGLLRLGSTARLVLIRDGRRETIQATVGEASAPALSNAGATIDKLQGAEFRNLDASDPRFGELEGVLVARVEPGSPAARNGLRQGDLVLAVNRVRVSSVRELSDAIADAESVIALNILRDNARLYIVIQ
jgi:serine protease DegQ